VQEKKEERPMLFFLEKSHWPQKKIRLRAQGKRGFCFALDKKKEKQPIIFPSKEGRERLYYRATKKKGREAGDENLKSAERRKKGTRNAMQRERGKSDLYFIGES